MSEATLTLTKLGPGHTLHLIGIDGRGLGEGERAVMGGSAAVFCSGRFRGLLADYAGEVLPITPLPGAIDQMAARLKAHDITVLAGGDPLFFGIGRTLIERFGAASLQITPALSTLQLAFARLQESWDDAAWLSLHGRAGGDLLPTLLRRPKVFLLTDRQHRPEVIAQTLATGMEDLGMADDSCRIMVAENLGMADERISHGSPLSIARGHFAELNVMIIRLTSPPPPCPPSHASHAPSPLGLTETEIQHSRGLITKDEVRAAILHHLRLPVEGILWDIGAGSGSVSIEAARLCPGLTVYAIERQGEGQGHIRDNRRRFLLANLHLMSGTAPEALAGLPAPDRVFIGGSGGQLPAIIELVCGRLRAGGIVVASAVTSASRELAPRLFHQHGLQVEMATITVSRETYPPHADGPLSLNPITIITGHP